MKKRQSENEIRVALEEPYNPTDERIEEIKQNAFKAYERYLKEKAQKPSFWQRIRNAIRLKRR